MPASGNSSRGPRMHLAYAQRVPRGAEARHVGHNPLGGWMIVALLATAAPASLTGWLSVTDRFWGVEWVQEVHEALGNAVIALAALHVAGVVYASCAPAREPRRRHGERRQAPARPGDVALACRFTLTLYGHPRRLRRSDRQHAADPPAPASESTGCEILGKAEFMNPGQSVKDRAALCIIRDAEKRGALGPAAPIVEGTAGNTGIGLALVGNARGYRTRHRHPRHPEPGEEGHAPALGAELVEVPAVPYKRPEQLRAIRRLAERLAQASRRRGLGEPVRQRRQPPGPLSTPPARRSGSRPAAGSTASSAPSAPAARWPASPRA